MKEDKSKLQLIGEIAEANNKNLELIEEINKLSNKIDKAIEHLKESIDDYLKDDKDLDDTCNVMCVETIKKRYLKPVLDILRGEDNE